MHLSQLNFTVQPPTIFLKRKTWKNLFFYEKAWKIFPPSDYESGPNLSIKFKKPIFGSIIINWCVTFSYVNMCSQICGSENCGLIRYLCLHVSVSERYREKGEREREKKKDRRCVCVWEREREKERERNGLTLLAHFS